MNNPLNRNMFRQAGMSKQPMGILASSPELMTTAQKAMMNNQPVRAEEGVYNVSKDRLSEYQNKNTQKNLKKQMVNSLSGEGSNKYANLFTIKDNESPLGFGIKKGLNFLNQLPPYLADNIDSAAQYLGRSRDYELTEEQLAKKAASERAGTPVKITDGKYGITKDIPQEYRGSSMDDRYEGLPTDSEMFKSGMERLRANELTEYKAGIGEKLAKIKSGKVTNETKVVADDKKVKKDKTVVNKDKNNLTINPDVAKKLKIRQDEIEAIAGKRTNLSNETVGSAIKDSAVEALANKTLSEDDKAKTVFEILKGKKSDGKAIKKDIRELLKDMTGTKPGITSTANYNLMMTGLLIASGESPNALTNIARGAAQGLQGYGQALEKERARGLETDLLAGKLAVGEFLEQKKEGRAKSDYVYGSDFTDKDGTVYKAGDAIKASPDQIIALQSAGVEVTDLTSFNNYQKLKTAIAGKKGTVIKGIEPTNKVFTNDLEFFAAIQSNLRNNVETVANLDKVILGISKKDQKITGLKGAFNTAVGKTLAAFNVKLGPEAMEKYGQKPEFDRVVDNALITFAVALLGEGGKTISNEERVMLYKNLKGAYDINTGLFTKPEFVVENLQLLRNKIERMGQSQQNEFTGKMSKYKNVLMTNGEPVSNIIRATLGFDKVKPKKQNTQKKSTLEKIIKVEPYIELNQLDSDE